MAGPSLQLGINAAGQDTIAGLNEQLALLRTNLSALKTAKVDTGTLTSANADIKKLSTSIADQGQALRTAFAELAEAVQGGFNKTAQATAEGGQKFRSMAAQERVANQKMYDDAVRQRAAFNATELLQIKAGGVQLVEAHRQVISATQAVRNQSQGTLGQVRNGPAPLATAASDTEISAGYAQHQQQMATQAAEIRASAFIRAETEADAAIEKKELQSFSMFAARERALAEQRVALALENAKLSATGIAAADAFAYQQNGARSQSITTGRRIAAAAPVFAAAADNSFAAEAERTAQAKAAAWIQAETTAQTRIEQTELEMARGFAVIEKEANAIKIAAAKESAAALAAGLAEYDTLMVAVERQAARDAAAIDAAALKTAAAFDAAAAKVKAAEARYQAAGSPSGKLTIPQANIQTAARSQLNVGLPIATVEQNFGATATGAAQAAGSIEALAAAHVKAGAAAQEHTPKLVSLSGAMNDAHSAARGLASGFGAMFLTWGNIAPLLAGAALSNAFVQTVKEGASVEQTLAVIKYQSEETDAAIDGLRGRLLALAQVGPQGPKEVAEAMKALSLAGLTASQVAVSVKDALTLSVVGEMPAQKAAESLVAISTAYGYSVGQFSRVNDVIAKTAAISMSSVSGMAESFRVSSVVAQQYGVTLEDMATALALVANIGIRNQQAGTAVTQFYSGLAGTTKKGSDALKALGVDSLDAAGKMKPLDDIAQQLIKSLSKLDPKEQVKAVAAAFNNRGQRTEGAIAASMVTPARDDDTGAIIRRNDGAIKDSAGNIVTVFQEVQRKIEESYGFAIIAMAGMSLTAENQMKSVGAAFQGALVQAFQDLQPSILMISKSLRETFNSDSFKSTLQGLVLTVGNLTVAIVDNLGWVKAVAEAWLLWKGAMIGAAIFTSMATGVTMLAGAFGALRASTLLAATGFTVLQASMGIIGLVLGGLAAAWIYYKSTTATSATSAADIARTSTAEMIKTLTAESDKIEARNQLLRDGVSAREADIRMAGVQAQADMAQVHQKASTESSVNTAAAATALEEARQKLSSMPVTSSVMDDVLFNSSNVREQAQRRVNQLEQQYYDSLRAGAAVSRQQVQDKKDLALAQAVVGAAQMEARRLDTPTPGRLPGGTGVFNPKKPKPGAEEHDEIAGFKKIFDQEEKDLKTHYDQVNKITALQHSSGQVSDIQYEIEQQEREDVYYNKRITDLNQFIENVSKARARIAALPGPHEKQAGEAAAEEARLKGLREELTLAQQFTQEQLKAKAFKQDQDITKFITQQRQSLDLRIQEADLKAKLDTLPSEERTVEEARLAEQGKFNEKLREQNDLLKKAQDYLNTLTDNRQTLVGGGDSRIAPVSNDVARLQAEIVRLQAAAAAQGDKAADATAARLKPHWQTLLDGWKNVTEQMRNVYDTLVDGFISKGEEMFVQFMKTGKTTATALLDMIRDTLAKNLYQTAIAPMMASLGQSFAKLAIGGDRPAISTKSPIDISAQATATSLDTMNTTGILPTTNAFVLLIEAAQNAANALWNVGASGGAGGGGGWLGSLFGSGSGAGTGVGGAEGSSFNIAYALGAPFGFAKGSPFTNHTFAQPTRFQFAGGAAMGEMGEAGPEAVMPLKRGADGSLGVGMHSGAQMQSNVSVVVENHSDGKARVQETKRGDGQREIRVIIDAAVQEVASSIQSGGVVGSVIESQYGMNRASGIPRR